MKKTIRAAIITALLAVAVVLSPSRGVCSEMLRAEGYSVLVDDRGKVSIKRDRAHIVTTSYAGMFGRLATGSVAYYIDVSRSLEIEKIGEPSGRPRLVITNSGTKGVTMRREISIEPEGVRLLHEISVPAGVAGSIDTGFTLNPGLTYGAQVSLWPSADAQPSATRLGAEDDCLPYRADFQKITFDSEWGVLSVEFETAEGTQGFGALLNGARSPKRPSSWVQVLPLFAGVAEGKPATTYQSACRVRFEPRPGKRYLSSQRNLLYNGGFEDWSNPDLPDGWRRAPHATRETAMGMASDDTTKFEGERSLRWTLENGALSHITQRSDYFAPAPVEAPCVFSVYLKSDPPGVRVALRCGRSQEQVQAGSEWQRFAVVADEGVGGRAFPVSIEKLSEGTLWVDAAQLEEGDEPTPFAARPRESIVGNPPFPEGLMADDIAQYLQDRPALGGCGPELSYYTSESKGHLIYDINLSAARRAKASLTVQLADPNGVAVTAETFSPPLPGRVTVEFDAVRLPLGTSHASATLTEAGKNLGSLRDEVIKLPPLKHGVEVKVNRLTRTLMRRGAPYIPVGSDATTSLERALECIRGQAANGFNHLHLWSGFYEYEETPHGRVPKLRPDELREILDRAHAAGMTVTVNLSHWLSLNHFRAERFQNKDVTDDELIERSLEVVRAARDHPALLTWHLFDEPSPAYCAPEWVERTYRAVKQADPYHLAEINICSSGRNMLSYLGGSDLMSIDIYPVPRSHLGLIAPHTQFMRLAGEWRPIRWWIQSFASVREPSAAEEMCMTYQAIVEGTRFILFYNYRPTSYAAWAGLGEIAREMQELTPALIAEREDLPGVEGGGGRVIASLHRPEGHIYVIAVNRDTKAVNAEFTLPLECVDRDTEVLFEGRRVACQGRVLKDQFAPMARHVYRFDL